MPTETLAALERGVEPKVLDQLRGRLRVKHYSIRTEQVNVDWVWRFILFHDKRHAKDLDPADVEAFLTHLVVQSHVSGSTQNLSQERSSVLVPRGYQQRVAVVGRYRGGTENRAATGRAVGRGGLRGARSHEGDVWFGAKAILRVQAQDPRMLAAAGEGHPSAVWVLRGTQVPVAAPFENLEDGALVSQLVEWFPGVTI